MQEHHSWETQPDYGAVYSRLLSHRCGLAMTHQPADTLIDLAMSEIARLYDALRMIGPECENYLAPSTCWTAGRTPGAKDRADAVCAHCIVARATTHQGN